MITYILQLCQLHFCVRSLVVKELVSVIPSSLDEGCCPVLDSSSGITEPRNVPRSINTAWFTVLQEQSSCLLRSNSLMFKYMIGV
jgi:hypothetical protein